MVSHTFTGVRQMFHNIRPNKLKKAKFLQFFQSVHVDDDSFTYYSIVRPEMTLVLSSILL